MNILIPMAGKGSRFAETGRYSVPKPLIEVDGKPMILRVIDNLGINGNYIFLVLKEHEAILRPVLEPKGVIVTVDAVTEGAACTCLLAKEFIDTEEDLLIANCDQLMEWNPNVFVLNTLGVMDMDGCILTFTSTSPKNSYAKVNRLGYVMRVAEKEVISDVATTGVYYWSQGHFMVEACEQMIAKNIRTNNEFYLCPCYNEMIEEGLIIRTMHVQRHWPIGTPEDLEIYLNAHPKS